MSGFEADTYAFSTDFSYARVHLRAMPSFEFIAQCLFKSRYLWVAIRIKSLYTDECYQAYLLKKSLYLS
jgi:hypothetical protein